MKKREKEKAAKYKEQLITQIKMQDVNAKNQITMERMFENLVVDSHNIRMHEEEERRVGKDRNQKKQFKKTWEHQMAIN